MIDLFPATRTFKALSLWQPWAALVTKGVKLHETRHWTTAYRRPHRHRRLDSLYVPSDLLDLRVCSAMAEKGLLARWEGDGLRGYELTPAGRAALETPANPSHEANDE